MPRQSILALGLAALALAFAPGPQARPSAAAEAPSASTGGGQDPATLAQHSVAQAEEPDILEVQPSLAIWTVVVFLGLFLILGKFAWKPLLQALHQREEHLEHVLVDTERARNESETLLAEHRRMLADADDKIRALFEEARRNAQAAADEMIQKARAEAEAERQRAKHDIDSARDQALMEIWSKSAEMAVSVAGRVLSRELNPEEHRRLIETAMNELPAANGHGGRTA